jgi:hypothetical protein
VALERLAPTSSGQVGYALKTAYWDGTTYIAPEPLEGGEGKVQAESSGSASPGF